MPQAQISQPSHGSLSRERPRGVCKGVWAVHSAVSTGIFPEARDAPQPFNTNQNPPKLPPWAAPAARDVVPHPARSSQPNWFHWWGQVVSASQQELNVPNQFRGRSPSLCQAGMSQPPRSVWAQQIFIGNLFMNCL